MKCPKCQFENPEDMKFCVECGKKLEAICSKCGFSNSPSFKFCGECGHNLALSTEPLPKDLSFDEKLGKIKKYLPKGCLLYTSDAADECVNVYISVVAVSLKKKFF